MDSRRGGSKEILKLLTMYAKFFKITGAGKHKCIVINCSKIRKILRKNENEYCKEYGISTILLSEEWEIVFKPLT